ncbi:L,D-transpeptidase [Roseicyclus sp. F158]|uniref:L,D-transpeptidase n=1 Tax=Tropicimonas omnivorans TaxID=3075590 RepID=A0ABU3DCB1_9RHOB|nr:L,D-transpeptidase [Roseicyclus sp. F158]MDT0681354.1 L,D-transpeptidase [Roseicyclus sp. F158]
MIPRRHFLATAAAAATTLPAAARAATSQGFTLPDVYKAQVVEVLPEFRPGTLHVDVRNKVIYWITGERQAIRYGVAVGEQGRNLSGTVTVGRKAEWPSWTPTANMIRREPNKYAQFAGGMPGGPENPLGARALYLYRNGRDTMYRVHGTPQPWSIGQSVSSGCVRLVNAHIEDLYERVPVGTKVTIHS